MAAGAPVAGGKKAAPAQASGKSNRMMRHHRLSVLVLIMVASCAMLVLPAAFGWTCAQAQAPPGHRQPRATDVPRDPSKSGTPRSPEDIALERALNNICRGCSPLIPVRDVPRYDLARACPASSVEASDRCRKDEETAKQKLNEQWTQFTEKARSDCVQSNEIGGRPSYVQLGICLRTAQLAPTLPEGR
jgi:hypothetical protein